ncbi:endonuclease/exonuclease/phosphatase family protein [Dyadobacter psychrotolerans]|uniref:Endonuclease/exonuclease/phosphatase family protein n=1 Tax=Dyadobacter psychrotolerans TaxID=2541721 RepID=A0A4R5DQ07_9BACT|nr:endonuclease/exonuclease/phosphatase family protein [Dyadobacter psychrotolerans]TDE16422.1 endonuclease/exonuclease/phosphatase family protein [Dyadobacter psychrotolerans]
MKPLLLLLIMFSSGFLNAQSAKTPELTFATYNVSMEAENYVPRGTKGNSEQVLVKELASGTNTQIKNIAAIIQTVRPDVILLNEFDYIKDPEQGAKAFIQNYLMKDQSGTKAISYPYFYYSTVNTGQPSPFDLNNDGKFDKLGNDAWGFGNYPGQYGMVLLSRYPIDTKNIRTFQNFKWKDMPGAQKTTKADGSDWYTPEAWAQFPLSSKSHWDVPVQVGNKTIHVLVSHPTPPTFDGAEDRNGKRNFDEIRFWRDYISDQTAFYIYDDKGKKGGLASNTSFVIMGDQNASPDEGNAITDGIRSLLAHPKINNDTPPASKGGAQHSPDNAFAKNHTAFWRMRADYVLPSKTGFKVLDSGVFWPAKGEVMSDLVEKRESSSDHRLVWVKVRIE